MDNNNNSIIIIILVVLVATLGGYIIITNSQSAKNDPSQASTNQIKPDNNKDQNDNQQEEKVDYPEWMKYILDSDNISVNIDRYITSTTEEADDYHENRDLTKDDLKDIFTKLADYPIARKYTLGTGFTDGDKILIKYTKNGHDYELDIRNDQFTFASDSNKNDKELEKLIDKAVSSTKDEDLKNEQGAFICYIFNNDVSKAIDKYFQ